MKRFVVQAKEMMSQEMQHFITIRNEEDVKGIAPIVEIAIQSDPIPEVGVNGIQARDVILYAKNLIEVLNNKFHSIYNDDTLHHLILAIESQDARTRDRENRNVEGKNEK